MRVEKNGTGYKARCPVLGHGQGRGDRNPSLSVTEGDDGRALVYCHAGCLREDVVAAAGLEMRDLFPSQNGQAQTVHQPSGIWDIRDPEGKVQAIHVRFDDPDGKEVLWKLPGTSGWGLKGRKLSTMPLYRSERVRDWSEDVPVAMVEGEKATDALSAIYAATLGTVTGAANTPGPEPLGILQGRRVVLWPDNDEEGRAHMQRVAEALQDVAAEVRIFEWDKAPPKGDAADHPTVLDRSKKGIEGGTARCDGCCSYLFVCP